MSTILEWPSGKPKAESMQDESCLMAWNILHRPITSTHQEQDWLKRHDRFHEQVKKDLR